MNKTLPIIMLSSLLVFAGCSSAPVKPSYVSPTHYQGLNCAQLHGEYARIGQYLKDGVEPAKHNGVGVGVGLGGGWGSHGGWGFGPSVSVNVGQSSESKRTEVARLFGEQDAIEQAATFKNCPIQHPRVKS